MAEITLIQAITQALSYEMGVDESVLVFGEDVGLNGGVFRATVGLQAKYGEDRVFDTPLAEGLIAGMAIGLAIQGFKPVAEFQFMGFIYPGLDQILNHAARMRNRTRSRLTCPIVYRAPIGGGIHAPEHHSESTEVLFAHIPGLRVVVPSSPARAYGLMLAAIRDPDPVLYLEPMRIYRMVKQNVPDNGKALPLDKCFVLREGSDVTLISWGASLVETQQAADELAKKGINAEVIDVATLKPLDKQTILTSVAKTGRCVIVQEASRSYGVAAEIAAVIAEEGLMSLVAPIQRVTGYDTIIPYYRLEKQFIPSVDRILQAVNHCMEY